MAKFERVETAAGYEDLNSDNVHISLDRRRIFLNIRTRFDYLYTYLKEQWCEAPFRSLPFPVQAVTPDYFILQNSWNIEENSRDKIMDAGWEVETAYTKEKEDNTCYQEISGGPYYKAGAPVKTYISEQYAGLKSVAVGSSIEEDAFLYYRQYPHSLWIPLPVIGGGVNQAIRVYERFEDKKINDYREFLQIRGVYKGNTVTMSLEDLLTEKLKPRLYYFPVCPAAWRD